MATVDSLDIQIQASTQKASASIDSLVKKLDILAASLKFDTTSLEKLGNINGNNFKKLGEGLQSFANAAKSLQNVNSGNFDKLANGIERIASIDPSKLEALGKIDGNSFRGLGEGIKALSSGLQGLQGVKKSDFNRLATGIERLAAIQPGNMEVVGNALRPLADGINVLSNAKFDNKNLTNLINSLTRLSNANIGSLANIDFTALGNSIKDLANALSGAEKVQQNTISMTNAIAKLASAGGNIAAVTAELPQLGVALRNFMQDMSGAAVVNPEIITFSQAIGTLANAGSKTSAAAAGLAALATELKKFMQVMATAPAVNQNIIQMVNALARLAAQGGRIGSSSRILVGGLNSTSSAMNRAKKSTFSLAAAFGKFYATYFLLIRGIKGFMKSVESTTDYIEAFNYYNVAFGKIASEWNKDFEKYGYENAESYAESFTERMNATLGKLSGVQVNLDTGLLEETGMQNLGLNIQQITQYASQLASVTNSIGQTGEVSLAAAKSMTMLAGDISSLFNVDYQSVADNLQSGLIGQSRALYKYGIDITNATLANYAYNLGLEKSVSEMTQAEKMQLRMLAILDQSKVSWGDLANTINSPSNMLRQFTNNAKELSMVFGQLFIPVLQKVMPIINGITIALKRLLVSFAQILGINIDFESFGQGYSEMEEGADGLSESLGGVADSAKKAKAGLRAFDELKVINTPDTSTKETGGGAGAGIDLTDEILKATEEYEKVWNEAFAKMENTAQAWADKIEKALEPIKKIFKDFAIGDFFQAGKDVSALVVSITDFFADAIDKVDWYGIGQKIGKFLEGIDWIKVLSSIGNLIWQAIKASVELWVGSFTAAPIETGLITALALMKFTRLGNIVRPKIVSAIMNTKLITSLTGAWTSLGGLKGILTTDLATIMGAGTATEIGTTIGVGIIGGLAAAFAGFNVGKEIGKWIFPEDAEWYDNFKWTGEGGFFDTISDDWGISLKALNEMWTDIQNNKLVQFLSGDIAGLMGTKRLTWDETKEGILKDFSTLGEELSREWNVFMENIDTIKDWFENSVKPWFTKEKWSELGNNMKEGLHAKSNEFFSWWKDKGAPDWFAGSVSPLFTFQKWSEIGLSIEDGLKSGAEFFFSWWENDGAPNWFNNSVKPVFSLEKWKKLGENIKLSLSEKWNNFSSWWNEHGGKKWFDASVSPIFSIDKWNFSGIADGLSQAWENAVAAIKNIWNKFVEWINGKLEFSWNPVSIMGKELVPGGSMKLGKIGKIPQYATGGFPEDGLFYANHNELIGEFTNGKTVTINNEQIVQGLADAIYPAVYNAVSAAMKNSTPSNGASEIRVYIGTREITDVAIEGIKDRVERTKKMPFPVYVK